MTGLAPTDSLARTLDRLATTAALAGGALLLGCGLLTVGAIGFRLLARWGEIGWLPAALAGPLAAHTEIVAPMIAVAAFAFLPYAHLRRGHVRIDLLTARVGDRVRAGLTAVADAALALAAAVLTWQTALAAFDLARYGQTTMVLRLPEAWAYWPAVAALGLLALVCLHTALVEAARAMRSPPSRRTPP